MKHKTEKLMHVEAVIPVQFVHDVLTAMEDAKGREIRSRPIRNGSFAEAVAAKPNGSGPGTGSPGKPRAKPGERQMDWIANHVAKKDQFSAVDIRDAFAKAGYDPKSIYSGITRAIKAKLIKRVKPGIYKAIA